MTSHASVRVLEVGVSFVHPVFHGAVAILQKTRRAAPDVLAGIVVSVIMDQLCAALARSPICRKRG